MKYNFFWKGYLSNWYMSDIIHDGVTYNCAEQFMMHVKALVMEDEESADLIMAADTPKEQKRLGRLVKNFDPVKWDKVKKHLMINILLLKFAQSEDLKNKLMAEKGDLFVEASPYDRIWGIGFAEDVALENVKDWGENLLGQSLTLVRETILVNDKLEKFLGKEDIMDSLTRKEKPMTDKEMGEALMEAFKSMFEGK